MLNLNRCTVHQHLFIEFSPSPPQATMVMASMLLSSLLPVTYPGEAASPTTPMSWNTCSGEVEGLKGLQSGCDRGGGEMLKSTPSLISNWLSSLQQCPSHSPQPPNAYLPWQFHLSRYIVGTLELLVAENYLLVHLSGGTSRAQVPPELDTPVLSHSGSAVSPLG